MNSIVLYTLKRVESGGWKTSEKEVVIIEARRNKKKKYGLPLQTGLQIL